MYSMQLYSDLGRGAHTWRIQESIWDGRLYSLDRKKRFSEDSASIYWRLWWDNQLRHIARAKLSIKCESIFPRLERG